MRLEVNVVDIADNQSTGATLRSGLFLDSSIDFERDVDFIRVELTAGRLYQFDMVGQSYGGGLTLEDPHLRLLDAGIQIVAVNDDNDAGLNSRIQFIASASGTYYLGASAFAGAGTYRLIMNESASTDDFGQSVTTAATLTLGRLTPGAIDFANDKDWFGLHLDAGVTYEFSLGGVDSGKGTLADPVLTLYSADGTPIGGNDDAGSTFDSLLVFTPGASGTYYLGAAGYYDTSGSYQISGRIAASGPTPAPPPAPGETDLLLRGGPGVDVLTGHAGNDLLLGGDGDDLLIGEDGVDSAVIDAMSVASMVHLAGGDIVVTSAEGTDTLRGIENITFLDVTISTEDVPAIVDTYATYLGRSPSGAEIAYWSEQLAAGGTPGGIRAAILADPLGQAHTAATVTSLYATYFGRDPSAGEIDIWKGAIADGADFDTLRDTLLTHPFGQAHTAATVTSLYATYFGRDPSAGEIDIWKGAIADGADFDTLRDTLLTHPFGQAHTAATVTSLYATYFGRDPSAGEIDIWKGAIADGADFDTLRDTLLTHPFGQAHTAATVTSLYATYFGRDPSAGEIDIWKGAIADGADFDTLRDTLLTHPFGQAHTAATVTSLYATYFGRDPSAGEIDIWKGAIADGADFDTLRDTLLTDAGSNATGTGRLFGSAGQDAFVFTGGRNLVIDGFDPEWDTLVLDRADLAGGEVLRNAREMYELDGSPDVLVSLNDGHEILFKNLMLTDLSAGDFVLT